MLECHGGDTPLLRYMQVVYYGVLKRCHARRRRTTPQRVSWYYEALGLARERNSGPRTLDFVENNIRGNVQASELCVQAELWDV